MEKLYDVCDFQGGSQPPKNEWSFEPQEGYVRMLQIRDFTQSEKVVPEYVKISSSTKQCVEDDILIARYGASIGKILTGLAGAYNVAIIKTLPDTNKIRKKYLYYYLKSSYFQNSILNVGFRAAQAGFNKEDLAQLLIECPSFVKQDEIIRILCKVEEVIEEEKKQLKKFDILIKSRFVEMFGDMANPKCWHPKYKLVEVCITSDDIKCGPFGTQLNKDEYQTKGIAVWEIPQINSGFTENPIHFLTNEKAEQLKAYSIEPGDIAMSRKGNVGKCGLFPSNYEKGIIHSDVLRIRVDSRRINPCFMMYQLHYSGSIQRQIEMVSSGAIMAGINVTKLKQIEVHVPELELQNQFATFVHQIDKLKFEQQRELEKAQSLFDSLMQQYFG